MQCRITQEGSLTHTIFMVLPGGVTFPGENFQMARGWLEDGLLNTESKKIMEDIIELQERTAESKYKKTFWGRIKASWLAVNQPRPRLNLFIMCIVTMIALGFMGKAWIDLHHARMQELDDRLLLKQLVEQREEYHGLRDKGKVRRMYIRYREDGAFYFKDDQGRIAKF
jgi:hypothetical protein